MKNPHHGVGKRHRQLSMPCFLLRTVARLLLTNTLRACIIFYNKQKEIEVSKNCRLSMVGKILQLFARAIGHNMLLCGQIVVSLQKEKT